MKKQFVSLLLVTGALVLPCCAIGLSRNDQPKSGAGSLTELFSVANCQSSGELGVPVDVGSRWVAFADSRLAPSLQSQVCFNGYFHDCCCIFSRR